LTLFVSALAGLAASLAFPPAELWPLAWIALAPWLAAHHTITWRSAAAAGAAVTAPLVLGMTVWIPGVVQNSFGGTTAGAVSLWLLAGLVAAPGGALLGLALRLVSFSSPLFPVWAGSAWAAYELSLASFFPQVPWLVLGATQIDTPLAPAAAVLGVHGVSALVVALNACAAQAARRVALRTTAFGLASVLVLAVGGAVWGRAILAQSATGTLRVAIVQPSSPLKVRETARIREEKLITLLDLTHGVDNVDLILWPESALSYPPSGRPDVLRRIGAVVAEKQAHLLLGAPEQSAQSRSIAVHGVGPGPVTRVIYEKRRLVPFAEAPPNWAPRWLRRSLGRITPSWPIVPGRASPLVEISGTKLELSICFEAAFSSITEDPAALLLVNLVNDGWYEGTSAAAQHLQLARWRTLERAAWLVRAAYNGTSGFVSPGGDLRRRLPTGARDVLVHPVPLIKVETPFERWGYGWLLASMGLIALGSAQEWLRRSGARPSQALNAPRTC
jgi:apolipoprotein N-acyltransferase